MRSEGAKIDFTVTFPAPNSTAQVESVINTLSTDSMRTNLETLTSYRTRCMCLLRFIITVKFIAAQITEVR